MTITDQVKQSIEDDLKQLEILVLKTKKRMEGLEKFIKETRGALT